LSQNKLIGWGLEIVSWLCFIAFLISGLRPCSETLQSAVLLGLQTCDQAHVELISLILFSAVFGVVAWILLRKDKKAILVFGAEGRVWGAFVLLIGAGVPSSGFGSGGWTWFAVLIMIIGVFNIWSYFKRKKRVQTIENQLMKGGTQRRSTGLKGSFSLDAETIDDQVTKVSPGVFALGTKEGKTFHVHYVGRSDADVNAELKEHVGEYDRFKFDYTDPYSSEAAFVKECQLYHDFGGPDGKVDNQHHPERPSDNVFCPKCGDPTQKIAPIGAVVSSPSELSKQFCVNCGTTLPAESKFCNKCGTQQP